MQLRELSSRNSAIAAGACLGLLAICGLFLAWWYWPRVKPELQGMVFFYDLNTDELISVPADTVGPIDTDSGPHHGMPAGVRAYVFCCGDFRPGDEYFAGTLEVPAAAVPPDQRPSRASEDAWLVRRPGDDKWHRSGGNEEKKMMRELRKRCPEDKPLKRLNPLPTEK